MISVKIFDRRRPTHSHRVENVRESLRRTSPIVMETARQHWLDGIGRQVLRFAEACRSHILADSKAGNDVCRSR